MMPVIRVSVVIVVSFCLDSREGKDADDECCRESFHEVEE